MKKAVLSFVLLICMINNTRAEDLMSGYSGTCGASKDDCYYDITDGVLTISGNGQMTSTPWRNIDGHETDIKSINVEDGLKSIDYIAFYNMGGVTSLTIPDSITRISVSAFRSMSNVTGEINISKNITYIDTYAFMDMKNVTGEIKLPEGLTSIGGWAFSGMSGITSLTIPDSVISIGNYAFYNMSSVANEINIPKNVKIIGEAAFSGMSHVTGAINLPEGLISVGGAAFYGMSSVTSLTIPDSVISIGNWAFGGMSGVTSLTIPDSVTSIGGYAFHLVKLSDLTVSAENLEKYFGAGGGLKAGVDGKINLTCVGGGCEDILAAKGYNLNNFTYRNVPKEIKNKDGSITLVMNNKIIGYKNKRIYTVEEANAVAGKVNTIRIKYR